MKAIETTTIYAKDWLQQMKNICIANTGNTDRCGLCLWDETNDRELNNIRAQMCPKGM